MQVTKAGAQPEVGSGSRERLGCLSCPGATHRSHLGCQPVGATSCSPAAWPPSQPRAVVPGADRLHLSQDGGRVPLDGRPSPSPPARLWLGRACSRPGGACVGSCARLHVWEFKSDGRALPCCPPGGLQAGTPLGASMALTILGLGPNQPRELAAGGVGAQAPSPTWCPLCRDSPQRLSTSAGPWGPACPLLLGSSWGEVSVSPGAFVA